MESFLPESLQKPSVTKHLAAARPVTSRLGALHFTADVMKRYAVGYRTVQRWLKSGLLPAPLKIGPRKLAWTDADLIVFESRRRVS